MYSPLGVGGWQTSAQFCTKCTFFPKVNDIGLKPIFKNPATHALKHVAIDVLRLKRFSNVANISPWHSKTNKNS